MTDNRNWCDDCKLGIVCPIAQGMRESGVNYNIYVKERIKVKLEEGQPAIMPIIQGCLIHEKDDAKVQVVK